MVLIGRLGIDKAQSGPAVSLTALEWRPKAHLTPSSRLARANGLTREQRRLTRRRAELFTLSQRPSQIRLRGLRFRGLMVKPLSESRSTLRTKGWLVLEANLRLDRESSGRRLVRRSRLLLVPDLQAELEECFLGPFRRQWRAGVGRETTYMPLDLLVER